MRTKLRSFVILFMFAATAANAQCDCDFTLQTYHPVRNEFGPSDVPGYQPGDIICLEAGNWKSILFKDIKGDANNPITITNCGGITDISGQYVGIQLDRCQYIRITGTGDPNETYGIRVDSMPSGTSGINITTKSSDVEVDHCEVANFLAPGGSGIVAKTDPDCNDSATWRGNFVMRNISIHDNYIHDTGDEGMYIGYTGGYESSKKVCNGVETFGHLLENVEIYNNIIERTGRDGLQVSLCTANLVIRNNLIMTYGNNGLFDQNFGLSVGSGSRARVHSNTIIQTSDVNASTWNDINARGISVLNALPPTVIYNNVVIHSAGPGVWMHQRLDMAGETQGWYVINNTIIAPKQSGIFYNSTIPASNPVNDQENWPNGFFNNIIVNPGISYASSGFWKGVPEEYIDFNKKNQRDKATMSHNYTTDNIGDLMFVDTNIATFDFHIDSLSPARNIGKNVTSFDINHDFDGRARVSAEDTVYDVGAYEWTKNPISIGIEKREIETDFMVYPNPATNQLNIMIDLDVKSDAMVRLMDLRGAVLGEANYRNLMPGSNVMNMPLDNVHYKGGAMLIVFTGDKTRIKTVILQ